MYYLTLKTYPMAGNNYNWTIPNCKEQCLWTQEYFSHEKKTCWPQNNLQSKKTVGQPQEIREAGNDKETGPS